MALGRELVARGHLVRVVTYGDAPSKFRYPYPVTRIRRGDRLRSRLPLFAREVWRVGKDSDLVYANDYGLPAMIANAALRKPLVMKIAGDFAWEYSVRHGLVPPDEPLEQFQVRRYGPRVEALRLMQSSYVQRADLVVTPSRYVERFVVRWGASADKIRVVENAVLDPLVDHATDRKMLRRRLRLPVESQTVLCIARLTPWKGIDTLIRAVARLRQSSPDVKLVIVGDGPDRERLETLTRTVADGAVRFAGELSNSDVQLYLRATDVVALCSAYEGLSHVLLEAMVAESPIVASSVGGNLELVRDGETGLLVPYGDVSATVDALRRVLADGDLARRLAGAARAEAAERTVGRMVDQTVAVFREAIAARGAT